MQTLQDSCLTSATGRARRRILRLLSAGLVGVLLTPAVSACSNRTPIRVASQEPDGLKTSACESAYSRASIREHRDRGPLGIPTPESFEKTAQAWVDAAVNCPARRDEATVYSARAHLRAWHQKTGDDPRARPSTDLTVASSADLDTAASSMGKDAATQAAEGEDQAGFAVSVLASRTAGAEWMLALSDAHTTAGQILVSHLEADPRPGTYSVQELLAHPDTIIDKANGLQAPTIAVVEMNAARTIVASIHAMTKTTTGFRQNGERHGGSAKQAAGDHQESLRVLTNLAISHLYLSLAFGYPDVEAAIFEPTVKS